MENWTVEEMKRLFALADEVRKEGKGLKKAFELCARETGRKPNSVRNYYYAQSKALSLLPEYSKKLGIKRDAGRQETFILFRDDELKKLIREVLIRQASGESVRAITISLGNGDKSRMLRLQNKYRSVIFNKKSYVLGVMKEMREEGLTFFNPYSKRVVIEGAEDKSRDESAVESVNALLRKFFEAQNERDKLDNLSDCILELGRFFKLSVNK
ncbi:hypothetical protein FACS1894211_07510 [Clostridia bacterium]|nr:hypothetical protein FACS1894211_07510 [Clostridia bacterium]